MAFRQRASCGIEVKPAKKTIIPTINTPRAKPKSAPSERLSQPKSIFLKIDASAIASRLDTIKVATNSTKKEASIRNDSVGISTGIIGRI